MLWRAAGLKPSVSYPIGCLLGTRGHQQSPRTLSQRQKLRNEELTNGPMVNVETLCSNEVLAGDSGKSTYGPSEERVCDSCMPREGRRGPVSTSGKRTMRAAPKK